MPLGNAIARGDTHLVPRGTIRDDDGRCVGPDQRHRALGDAVEHALELQGRGDHGDKPPQRGQLLDLAVELAVGQGVRAGVLDGQSQVARDHFKESDLVVLELARFLGLDVEHAEETVQ